MTDARIAALEAKITAAQAELAEIKAGEAPPPPKDVRAVSITELLTERSDGMPTLKELQQLYGAVKHLAPWPLNNKYDEHRPFRGFCSCFRWLSNKGRIEQPNPKFALSFWIDQCKGWTHDRSSMTADIDAPTLILAVFAIGDVRFVPANPALGHTWELGLAEHSGKPASPDAWKRIMREGASAILPPSAPVRRIEPASPVKIYGGGY
jgi:hypothetical protein